MTNLCQVWDANGHVNTHKYFESLAPTNDLFGAQAGVKQAILVVRAFIGRMLRECSEIILFVSLNTSL